MVIRHLKATAYEVVMSISPQEGIVESLRGDKDIMDLMYLKEEIGPVERLTMVLYLSPLIHYSKRKEVIENKINEIRNPHHINL